MGVEGGEAEIRGEINKGGDGGGGQCQIMEGRSWHDDNGGVLRGREMPQLAPEISLGWCV